MTIKIKKKNSDTAFALHEMKQLYIIHSIIFDVLVYSNVILFRSRCIGDFINSKNTFFKLTVGETGISWHIGQMLP